MLPSWNYIFKVDIFYAIWTIAHLLWSLGARKPNYAKYHDLLHDRLDMCTNWLWWWLSNTDDQKDVQDASVQEERLRCAVKDTRLVQQEPCDMCRIPCIMSWNHVTFIKFHVPDIMIHVTCTMKHVVAPCNIILYRIVTPLLHNVPQNWTTPDI